MADELLTERRDRVSCSTINRARRAQRDQPRDRRGARRGARRGRGRRRRLGRRAHRQRRQGLLRRHGPQGVRRRRGPLHRARLRRDHPAQLRQAPDRRGQRRGAGGRPRGHDHCDLVVAADHARFGIPEASVGLIAGAGGLIRLAKRIPLAVALELALTADPSTPSAPTTSAWSTAWCPQPSCSTPRWAWPRGSRATRRWRCASPSASCARPSTSPTTRPGRSTTRPSRRSGSSADAMEGAVAFAEKREPRWRGA